MGISVVIPAYNSEAFLSKTVGSVQGQTYTAWEIVIVNDGSRDRTGPVADDLGARDARIQVIHGQNGGTAAARNRGLEASRSDYPYVLFLDADDLLWPTALQTLLSNLEADPLASGAHGLAEYIDADDRPSGPPAPIWGTRDAVQGHDTTPLPVDAPTSFASFAYRGCIPTPGAVLLRKSALAAVGPFDTEAKVFEDLDMYLRLTKTGTMRFVPQVVIGYRQHGSNGSGNLKRMVATKRRIRAKHLHSPDTTVEQRRLLQVGHFLDERRAARMRLAGIPGALRRGDLVTALRLVKHGISHFWHSCRPISRLHHS